MFKVYEIPNKKFKREGYNLRYFLDIDIKQAYKGFKRIIRHLDGLPRTVSKQGLTQHGEIIILEGEGMPKGNGRGNLIVEVSIKLPKKLKNKDLVEEALSDNV